MKPVEPPSTSRNLGRLSLVVVKVGSAVLAPEGTLDPGAVARLSEDLIAASARGVRIILVSSGAVASGFRALGLAKPPKTVVEKQAAAAIGQSRLMGAYADAFARRDRHVAQVLLTSDDLASRKRFLTARSTLLTLLDHGVTPVVNENDSVVTDEIKLGDNDTLAAQVAAAVRADLLIILSSIEGLHESFVNGKPGPLVPVVRAGEDASRYVSSEKTTTGVGGMATKLRAAKLGARSGFPTILARGTLAGVVTRVLAGEALGTIFLPQPRAVAARTGWIGFATRPRGRLIVDDGARRAIVSKGASLLASGIVEVSGAFAQGDAVEIRGRDGVAIARGLAGYSAAEIDRIKGLKSSQIAGVLGYAFRGEVVHRDDLAVLPEAQAGGRA